MRFLNGLGKALNNDPDRALQNQDEPDEKYTPLQHTVHVILLLCAIGFVVSSLAILVPVLTPR